MPLFAESTGEDMFYIMVIGLAVCYNVWMDTNDTARVADLDKGKG